MRRIKPTLVAAVGIAFGALDLDYVGSEVGKHHRRAGTRDERALLDDPDPAEWQLEHQSPGTKPAGEVPS